MNELTFGLSLNSNKSMSQMFSYITPLKTYENLSIVMSGTQIHTKY